MTTAASETKPDTRRLPKPASDASDLLELFPIKLRLPEAVISAGPDACANWFWKICDANHESVWQMELTADGELELMPPTFEPSDIHEINMSGEVYVWNNRHGAPGQVTGSTSGYRLSNGALRVPDAAWTALENVRTKQPDDPGGRPYCPDFVVEIRSTSQSRPLDLAELLNKMREYMENGAKLGWLIDPLERTVRIYRAGADEPELLQNPETLNGEDVLFDFVFPVRQLIFDLV